MIYKFFVFIILFPIFCLANEQELNDIYQKTKCLTCQGQSIYESNSEFANDLKTIIKEKFITEKVSRKEVEKELVERFGPEILFKPEFAIPTYLLWFAPFILLLLSFIAVILKFLKKGK